MRVFLLAIAAALLGQQAGPAIVEPTRTSTGSPAFAGPPSVPPSAESLPPITLRVMTTWNDAGVTKRTSRQMVLRSTERVLVVEDEAKRDWLFERNPVDRRRATGYLVDHRARTIVVHEESALRASQQIRGWSDVLSLRIERERVLALRDTGERRTAFGLPFTRYAAAELPGPRNSPAPELAEVWWNDEQLLPLEVRVRQGTTSITSRIESLERGVAEARLASASKQFPSYQMFDVADADAREH
jgi:hypothetical protein